MVVALQICSFLHVVWSRSPWPGRSPSLSLLREAAWAAASCRCTGFSLFPFVSHPAPSPKCLVLPESFVSCVLHSFVCARTMYILWTTALYFPLLTSALSLSATWIEPLWTEQNPLPPPKIQVYNNDRTHLRWRCLETHAIVAKASIKVLTGNVRNTPHHQADVDNQFHHFPSVLFHSRHLVLFVHPFTVLLAVFSFSFFNHCHCFQGFHNHLILPPQLQVTSCDTQIHSESNEHCKHDLFLCQWMYIC